MLPQIDKLQLKDATLVKMAYLGTAQEPVVALSRPLLSKAIMPIDSAMQPMQCGGGGDYQSRLSKVSMSVWASLLLPSQLEIWHFTEKKCLEPNEHLAFCNWASCSSLQ